MQNGRDLMEVRLLQMTHPAHRHATRSIDPPDLKLRNEPVHVNMSVVFQLGHKLSCQYTVDGGWEVAQGILHSQLKPEPQSGNHINETWRKE